MIEFWADILSWPILTCWRLRARRRWCSRGDRSEFYSRLALAAVRGAAAARAGGYGADAEILGSFAKTLLSIERSENGEHAANMLKAIAL